MKPVARFDSVARPYRALERLALGASLEAARFALMEHLDGCDRVLVLGEGDGRFLKRLLGRFPRMRVTCVDASAAMLASAAARLTDAERARVEFRHADARELRLEPASHDAAVTLFFLDCFDDAEAAALIARVAAGLRADACWLWADFAQPARGWRRLRAKVWLAVLYSFFRWTTGLRVSRLPAIEAPLRVAGFTPEREVSFQAGLLRSVLWRRGR